MKVAVFSDVHGNAVALDAVLADAAAVGVDEHWVIGDLVASGPLPAATLDRLRGLSPSRFVRGNTDRYVLRGDFPAAAPRDDVELMIEVSQAFGWTRGAITAAGGYDWLQGIPLEDRLALPDGTRVLLVHASPGTDDGAGLQQSMSDDDFVAAGVTSCGSDLLFVGHTHVPLDRTVAGVRVVNLGSVSMHVTEEKRAMWTLLTADDAGYEIERRYVDYDRAAAIRALETEHYPSPDRVRAKLAV